MPKLLRRSSRPFLHAWVLLVAALIVACTPAPVAFQSDDFNNCALDTGRWSFVDPVGDGSASLQGVGTADVVLALSVGGGVSHDVWSTGNQSARVMQSIGDADFGLEAKFESVPTLGYQMQGILVEGSGSGNLLRFDFFSDGTNLHIYSASFANNTPTVRVDRVITSGAPLYMRVVRQSNQWTLSYSYDGASWTQAVSYSQAITVTGAGVFAGNAASGSNPPPAFTALVDYVFNLSAPISPEDAPGPTPSYALTVATSGSGTVSVDPSGGLYACGTEVTLTAVPDPDSRLSSWTGALSGDANPATLSMTGPRLVTAKFVLRSVPPAITNVQVVPDASSATVTWTTDEPATSQVAYGATTSYELGSVADPTLTDSHSMTIPGLAPSTSYHVQISSTDGDGYTSTGSDVVFTTAPPPPSGLVSDDFNAFNIDPSRWSFVDPRGDSTVGLTGVNTGDAHLVISVPAGPSHDAWITGNNAARLMQAAVNADFGVTVKFDSLPSIQFQDQGIMVQQAPGQFLRFDIYWDGSALRLFSASIAGGAVTTFQNDVIPTGLPLYLRVNRVGNQWSPFYSGDGQNWIAGKSFTVAMTVASVGVYAGNAPPSGSNASPAFSALIDYFEVSGLPLLAEDAATVQDVLPPLVYDISAALSRTSGGADVGVQWQTDEPATARIEFGLTTSYELGSLEDASLATMHSFLLQGLLAGVTYHFRVTSVDALGHVTVSADQTIVTDVSSAPLISAWYGESQEFGGLGIPQPWVNVLGNVQAPNGLLSFTYSLNGGPPQALSIGPDTRRLVAAGDFNVELAVSDLRDGDNEVDIRAVDPNGLTALEIVHFQFTSTNSWPLPYSIDWTNVSRLQDVCQVVDGNWSIDANGLRPIEIGYDRLVDIGDLSWSDYEVTAEITIHSIDPAGFNFPSNGPVVGLLLRWLGHVPTPGAQPSWQYWPFGAGGWYKWNSDGSEQLRIVTNPGDNVFSDPSGRTLSLEVPYVFKMRVETRHDGFGNPYPFYSLKVWQSGTPEPASWDITAAGAVGDPVSGSFLLVAHQVDATFGPISATPLTP
jgi:regulation of enolase protein 1 (concanavalin A-like superfamily)